jgi:hypothetical protein
MGFAIALPSTPPMADHEADCFDQLLHRSSSCARLVVVMSLFCRASIPTDSTVSNFAVVDKHHITSCRSNVQLPDKERVSRTAVQSRREKIKEIETIGKIVV